MGKWQLPLGRTLLTSILAVALCACGRDGAGARSLERPDPENGPPPLGGLPIITDVHGAAVAFDDVRNGAETSDRSSQATDSGTALQLTAAPDEICWGTWTFNAGGREYQRGGSQYQYEHGKYSRKRQRQAGGER